MDLFQNSVAAFAILVLLALIGLIVKGTAGFLFQCIAQIANAIFSALVWTISAILRFVGWLLVGWWWRKWVAPGTW